MRTNKQSICTRHRPAIESATDSHVLYLLLRRTGVIRPSRRCSDMLRIADAFPRDGQGIAKDTTCVQEVAGRVRWPWERRGEPSARARRASYKLGRKVRKIRAKSLPARKRERGISPCPSKFARNLLQLEGRIAKSPRPASCPLSLSRVSVISRRSALQQQQQHNNSDYSSALILLIV